MHNHMAEANDDDEMFNILREIRHEQEGDEVDNMEASDTESSDGESFTNLYSPEQMDFDIGNTNADEEGSLYCPEPLASDSDVEFVEEPVSETAHWATCSRCGTHNNDLMIDVGDNQNTCTSAACMLDTDETMSAVPTIVTALPVTSEPIVIDDSDDEPEEHPWWLAAAHTNEVDIDDDEIDQMILHHIQTFHQYI